MIRSVFALFFFLTFGGSSLVLSAATQTDMASRGNTPVQASHPAAPDGANRTTSMPTSLKLDVSAKLRHAVGATAGRISLGPEGVEFRPVKGERLKWSFRDIQSFYFSPHQLVIETYTTRKHHLPGVRRYRFELAQAAPPATSAQLARDVGRPSQNAVADPTLPSVTEISVHHRTRAGGTNGTLRFRSDGIDYVTSSPGDSRSWRWSDLRTLAKPDPYHLYVFGYRDTYTFDLKGSLSRALFDHCTDAIYGSAPHESDGTLEAPGLDDHRGGEEDE